MKKPLNERFQELAGIKPLNELEAETPSKPEFTDAGGNPISFETFIGDFAAGVIPEEWDVDEDGTYEDEIEAFTSEEYDEDAVANYNAAYDILSKSPFTHTYDTGEVLSITALDNGNLKFVYTKEENLT